MYFRDYLEDIPLKMLVRIAESLKIKAEYKARIKLINAIDKVFWNDLFLERLISELPEKHQNLLSLIAFSYSMRAPSFVIENKMHKLYGISKKNTHDILNDLMLFAFIGGVKKGDSEIYFCPSGLSENIRKYFLSTIIKTSEKPVNTKTSSPDLFEDVVTFLASLYKEPAPVTQKGNIKKNTLERIFSGSPTCANGDSQISVEQRNSFINRYLESRELIKVYNDSACSSDKLHGWLDLSFSGIFNDILEFTLSDTIQDNYLISSFCGVLAESQTGTFFDLKEMASFFDINSLTPLNFSKIETRLTETSILMNKLGLMEFYNSGISLSTAGEKLLKTETHPFDTLESKNFIVQPNFEIITGPELSLKTRFMLELLSTRKSRDIALTYTITQEDIIKAREKGYEKKNITGFFKKYSKNLLPQNVLYSIENWADIFGSVYFENVTLMRFRDESTRERAIHIPSLNPLVKEKLSEDAVVVWTENTEMIVSILRKAGLYPDFPDNAIAPVVEKTSQFIAKSLKKNLVNSQASINGYPFICLENNID